MKYHLAFTIGPVQTFVSQARRTRDFWCGSWLLSFLAESALAEAERAGGHAVIPFRKEEDRKKVTSVHSPFGGIPNRFELSFDSKEAAAEAGKRATKAFKKAWKKVAKKVREEYLKEAGSQTIAIWKRQVSNFWEVSWVVGEVTDNEPTLGRLTAARKQFRNVAAQPEGGIKCSMMPTMQELSGQTKSSQIEAFWKGLPIKRLDRRDNERLCAIALIKRLLPNVSTKAVGFDLRKRSWPSTAFVAATPWLRSLDDARDADKVSRMANDYSRSVMQLGFFKSETEAATTIKLDPAWASIDAPVWFANSVKRQDPLESEENDDQEKQKPDPVVVQLKQQLRMIYEAADPDAQNAARPPIPYYAMLAMDGDNMGRLLKTLRDPTKLSKSLCKFTDGVNETVQKHDGWTIYAGGDDVLAMVPAKSALKIAMKLSQKYAAAFEEINCRTIKEATISAAIVYAHWRFPLRQILKTAHRLLDDVAKDATRRDALAIGIVQGSGLNAQWSAPWAAVRGSDDFPKLKKIIKQFGSDATSRETTPFNASYLYHLRDQFSRLFSQPQEMPGDFCQLPDTLQQDDSLQQDSMLLSLATAELRRRLRRADREKIPLDDTRQKVAPLMQLSQRAVNKDGEIDIDKSTFGFDGWRVARFLKQVQDGKVDSHE